MFHDQTAQESLLSLSADDQKGLTPPQVSQRIQKFGLNQLPEIKKESIFKKVLEQFSDVLVLILIAAALISFVLGEKEDALAILAIVILNGVLGFIQEYQAEKALEALKKLAAPLAKVLRNGTLEKIEAQYLVPGDIIILEAGDKVPADARLTESFNLKISEAILTGESEPVEKEAALVLTQNTGLADRRNMVYKDTTVTYGRGRAVVVYTGRFSEVGRISQVISETREEASPLKIELNQAGRTLSVAALLTVFVVFILGVFFDHFSPFEMFLTSVSLAVAAIPEGLPAVITIVLAIGVGRMAKHNAIVKKLPAVEALGSTTHILTDKTGTLTQNKITVHEIVTFDNQYQVAGQGYSPVGFIFKKDHPERRDDNGPITDSILDQTLKAAVLVSDATIEEKNGQFVPFGDTTEAALIVAAERNGLKAKELKKTRPRVYEVPFTSEARYMMTVCQNPDPPSGRPDQLDVYVKGAPEVVLELCTGYLTSSGEIKGSLELTSFVESETTRLTKTALRSLAVATKKISVAEFEELRGSGRLDEELKKGFQFLALFGLRDAVRPEALGAVGACLAAGITPIMITGDHKATALAIGRQLGLVKNEDEVIDGENLAKISDEELREIIRRIKIFARVDPAQKLRIVKAFKAFKNNVVAVTGDGVNDAPAIKAADVGIAMGIEGTDVSREVADLVLKDDNFATIVEAVKQGRVIYTNLVKFIRYLISCNISEILVILLAILAKLPLPLEPIQLLWVNLVTDGLPALALGMEKEEFDVMKEKPRLKSEGVLTKKRWRAMSLESLVMGITVSAVFYYLLRSTNLVTARTGAFSALALSQLFHAFNNRSEHNSIFKLGVLSNPYLTLTFLVTFALQLFVIYSPFGHRVFDTANLPVSVLLLIFLSALSPVIYSETTKFLRAKNRIR